MARILLVDTNTTPFNEACPVYPTGLDYLRGALREEGLGSAQILDLTRSGGPLDSPDPSERQRRSLRLLRHTLERDAWDIVGLSLRNIDSTYPPGNGPLRLHYYLPGLLDYLRCACRHARPQTWIVLGGTAFSMMPEVFLRHAPERCCGVLGPGETAFARLIRSIQGGEAVSPLTRSTQDQIGTLGDTQLLGRYMHLPTGENTFGIRTKIGCSQHCSYCPYPFINGPGQTLKSPERVAEELALLRDVHCRSGSSRPLQVMFADDLFNRPQAHATAILETLLTRDLLPDSWHAYLDPGALDETFVEWIFRTRGWRRWERPDRAGDAQFMAFSLDIESGSPRILQRLGKPYGPDEITNAVEAFRRVAAREARAAGLSRVSLGFHVLLGPPGECRETVAETCALIRRLRPDRVAFQVGVRIYPGTPLARETQGACWQDDSELEMPVFTGPNRALAVGWLEEELAEHYGRLYASGSMLLLAR